ncbi:MAG: ethanolamine utilization protein EutN [Candidatus Latescibacterota bacterium]|nr:MAG: ethanolamine utilization protein EutN [Candidatus Latescibacterota bacterium]
MRLGRVIGTVVATQKADSLAGKRLLVVQPVDEKRKPIDRPVIAVDTVSAGPGEWVYFVEKREAAKAFPGPELPVDVTILGILDRLEIEP